MEFLVQNYRCLQNPWLGGYRTPDPRSVLCPQLNLLNPLRKKFLGTPLLGTRFSVIHLVVDNALLTTQWLYSSWAVSALSDKGICTMYVVGMLGYQSQCLSSTSVLLLWTALHHILICFCNITYAPYSPPTGNRLPPVWHPSHAKIESHYLIHHFTTVPWGLPSWNCTVVWHTYDMKGELYQSLT